MLNKFAFSWHEKHTSYRLPSSDSSLQPLHVDSLSFNSREASKVIFPLEMLLKRIFIHTPNLAQFTPWWQLFPSPTFPAILQLSHFSLMIFTIQVHFKCITIRAPNLAKFTTRSAFSPFTFSLAHLQPLHFSLVFVPFQVLFEIFRAWSKALGTPCKRNCLPGLW